jgi:hypothetical protein
MSLDIWHHRFGHVHHAVIKKMEAENSVIGFAFQKILLIPSLVKDVPWEKAIDNHFQIQVTAVQQKLGQLYILISVAQ